MSEDPDVRKLLAPMVDRAVDLDGAPFRVDRQRVLAHMAKTSRPARRPWFAYLALAAAGAGAIVFATRLGPRGEGDQGANASLELQLIEGHATLVGDVHHPAVALVSGAHLAPTGELETSPGAKAQVRAPDGLAIELGGETRVSLGELRPGGQRPSRGKLKLLGGTVHCVVPHRAEAAAFEVVTPDVTVLDLGTVFTVSLDRSTRTTRVTVDEGEVMIRHASGETRVTAPGSWSNAPAVAVPAPGVEGAPRPTIVSVPRATAKATLGEEARLLREGLAAERQGRFSDAQSALARLLRRYPRSPLAPDARSALVRVEAGARR